MPRERLRCAQFIFESCQPAGSGERYRVRRVPRCLGGPHCVRLRRRGGAASGRLSRRAEPLGALPGFTMRWRMLLLRVAGLKRMPAAGGGEAV